MAECMHIFQGTVLTVMEAKTPNEAKLKGILSLTHSL